MFVTAGVLIGEGSLSIDPVFVGVMFVVVSRLNLISLIRICLIAKKSGGRCWGRGVVEGQTFLWRS